MRVGELFAERYVLERRSSAGGMGAVWRALDRETGQRVALKVLHDPVGAHAARFLHEARILARLQHRHIVRHVGHGVTTAREPYLAMEWLEGEDLSARLARGRLSLDETLDLVQRVADAVSAAHDRGIVHRDIKPSNLFLVGGDTQRVRVLDFGIARRSETSITLTRPSAVMGTPGYMAPEQARGEGEVGPSADVFSLGCVLFECLAGRPAFQGAHPMALLAKLLLEDPPRLIEVCPDIPWPVSDLCERMLSKNPHDRPANGAALASALVALETSVPSYTTSMPRSQSSWRISATERRLMSIVAITPPNAPESLPHSSSEGAARSPIEEVRRVTDPLGASAYVLVDGTILVVLLGGGSPTDQAAHAARAALTLRAHVPGGHIALVTGRSEVAERLPVGEIVERAAYLLDLAGERENAGAVIVDDVTQALLDPRFEVESREPAHAWLLRERPVVEEVRKLLGKPSPFVGRDRELRTLVDMLEEGFDERRAQAILVTAPTGMGKSRLRQELVSRLRERHRDLAYAVGHADSLGAGAAFSHVASGLQRAMGIEVGEPPDVLRQKVSSAVGTFLSGDTADRVSEFLGELVGATFPDEKSPRLRSARHSAQLMAAQITEAYVEFARAAARARPTLLVLDDLHLGDASSVKLVDTTLRELRSEPFAVLAFARPEIHDIFPRMWSERNVQEMRLGPLPRRAAEMLVRGALGDGVDPARVARILNQSEGNTFYLEELVRAFTEGRGDSLPETVLGMVEARISALPPYARRFLRAASVFGEVFWTNGVRKLLGERKPVHIEATVSLLVERELLTHRYSRRFAGEEELSFQHALVREGAYAMLTERDKAMGHALAGAWLESVGEPEPAVLAMHFERGEQDERAAFFHARAAQMAMRGNNLFAAASAVERGLSAGPADEVAADLWALRARIESARGDYDASLRAAEEVLQSARPGSVAYCLALEGALGSAMLLGRSDTLRALGRRLLVTEPDPQAISALARAFAPAVAALTTSGQRQAAALFMERLRSLMEGRMDEQPAGAAALAHALSCWEFFVTGDLWRARSYWHEALKHLEIAGEQHLVPVIAAGLGAVSTGLGALEEAEGHLDRALAEASPGSQAASVARSHLASLRLAQGRSDEAMTLARATLQAEGQRQNFMGHRTLLVLLGAHLERGEIEAAEALLDAMASAKAESPASEAAYRWSRARILLAQAHFMAAAEECALAVTRHREAGIAGLEPVLLTLAEARMAAGDAESAKAALRDAQGELSARAAKIDDPAFRESFLERVAVHARIRSLAKEWL